MRSKLPKLFRHPGLRIGFGTLLWLTLAASQLTGQVRTIVAGQEKPIVPGVVAPETPRVIYGRDGSKAVVWSQLLPGTSNTVVCIQFIDENDEAITTPLIVNEGGTFNDRPSVAIDDSGRLGIFWRQDAGQALRNADGSLGEILAGPAIVGRFFNPDTMASTGDMVVSTGNTETNDEPEVAIDKSGEGVVTWNGNGRLRRRRIMENGSLEPSSFMVAESAASGADGHAVARSATGRTVFVWKETGTGTGIKGRLFDHRDVPVRSFNVTNSPSARKPDVAMDDNGGFVVVWEEDTIDDADPVARSFNPNGTPVRGAYRPAINRFGDQTNPTVDVNSTGDVFFAWETDRGLAGKALAGENIVGRFFNPTALGDSDEFMIAEEDPNGSPAKPEVSIDDRDNVTITFERRGPAQEPGGIFRKQFESKDAPAPCVANGQTLCLNNGRFKVTSSFEDFAEVPGTGQAVQLTTDTGYFWFFDQNNVEIVVKALDACSFANSFWVFAAGLTSVEANLIVEDTQTGESVTYYNRSRDLFEPIQDTAAFKTCDTGNKLISSDEEQAISESVRQELAATLSPMDSKDGSNAPGWTVQEFSVPVGAKATCSPSATTLCLRNDRFDIEVDFETSQGNSGQGQQRVLTTDTGYFWFFDQNNVEIVVKVLSGCGINQRYWIFAGGLTDVEVRMVVVDRAAGLAKEYVHPGGSAFAPIQDTNAFASCP